MSGIKGFKIFDKDLKCRDMQYEIGKAYIHKGNIGLCQTGFHFCKNVIDCFNYYEFDPENRICEIIAKDQIIHGDNKSVTNNIVIGKELTWNDILELCNIGKNNTGYKNSGDSNSGNYNSGDSNSGYRNSGDSNSGNYNSGDSNSGYRNSGYRNSGDYNSGYRNSGDYNSGDYNSGMLNTDKPKLRIFDMETNVSIDDINFPNFFYFQLNQWISEEGMTNQEKKDHPNYETTKGYLKTLDYKEAWRLSWDNASLEDRKKCLELPNWDNEKFKIISGIDVEKELQ